MSTLKEVLPENLAIQQQSSTSEVHDYFSEVPVEKTPDFDVSIYANAMQAKAGMAQHIDMVSTIPTVGPQHVSQIKHDLAQYTDQLRNMTLPDTRVNVKLKNADGSTNNLKIEIPYSVKQYASSLDQRKYAVILSHLLHKDDMDDLLRHTTKANQRHTPALWLCQKLVVETKKPYVYLLKKDVPLEAQIDEEKAQIADQALVQILGGELHESIKQIATVNSMNTLAVFTLIVRNILSDLNVSSVPMTATSIWDGLVTPDDSQQPELNTALKFRG